MDTTESRQAQSRRKRSRKEAPASAANSLSTMLEDKDFLLMVLEKLVSHGLQDCRLVCRRWRNACKQFPVKLQGIRHDQLDKIDAFPNAISISLNSRAGRIPGTELFARLSNLPSLRSLHLSSNLYIDSNAPPPSFQSMKELTELRVVYIDSRPYVGCTIESIKYLTNLVKLELRMRAFCRRWEPFVELEKIQELKITPAFFFDEHGASLFPALTNLTMLDLRDAETSDIVPHFDLEVGTL